MCYHLVEEIEELKAENNCCMKFAVDGAEHEICSNEPTDVCIDTLKQIMSKMYNECMDDQSPTPKTGEPLTCGTDEEYEEAAESHDNPEVEAALEEAAIEAALDAMPTPGSEAAADLISYVTTIITSITTITIIRTEYT